MDTDALAPRAPRQPRRARGLMLAALVAAGVLAILLAMGHGTGHAPTPGGAEGESLDASGQQEAVPAPAAAITASQSQPAPEPEARDAPPALELPPILEALRQRADAGDGDAAWELVTLLRRCASPLGAEQARDRIVDQEARRRERGGEPVPDAQVAAFVERMAEAHATCEAIGPLPGDWAERDRLRRWAHDVAAEAGQREAQALYAFRVREEFSDVRRMLAAPERARRLHERSRHHLEEALEAGEPVAFGAAAQAASLGLFSAPDPREARAWTLVFLDAQGRASWPAAIVAERRARTLAGLSPADVEAAERRARELASSRRLGP